MSFSTSDIAEIKWSLGTFIISIVVTVGLINSGQLFEDNALKARQSALQQLNEVRTQLSTAQSDLENMATYLMEYQALEAQKVIGTEQRLDWVEGLEKIRKQGHVLDFKYSIGPQQSYAPNPPLDAGNFALNLSPMTLQIDLLHEGQLDHLFVAMQTQMQGWFILDRCSFSSGTASDGGVTALKADCAGGWLTMKNRNAP